MKSIDADLRVLAKINFAGETYELREVNFQSIVDLNDSEDKSEAVFDLFESAGIPRDVAKKFSVGTIKQVEQLLAGELASEKK